MSPQSLRSTFVNQHGIALPLALIVLTLLTSLTLAFLAMSASEPMIAANLKAGEQALALAEAGIDRAIWALMNPTVDTAGANTKLTNLNAIPAAYSAGPGQLLFPLTSPGQASPTGAFSVTIAGAGPITITGHGYIPRNGVAVPAQPAQLAQSDTAARRIVQFQVTSTGTVGGPAAPANVKLPGALTVAGTVQLSGHSLVDGNDQAAGTPNNCAAKAGATIRQQTKASDGTESTNSINVGGAAQAVGAPGQQTISGDQNTSAFQQYLFTDAQLAALKSLAQSQGTYVKPTSNAEFILTLTDGLTFVDSVNGQDLGNPADPSKMASVKITGANNNGWLIVMGNLRIDGNVTYNGLMYADNTFTYKGTGTGGIYGAIVSANAVDAVASVVDASDSGNSKIYYDCVKVANGGSAFNSTMQNALNASIVTPSPGTWREVSN